MFYPELISTGLTLTELCEALSALGLSVKVVCGPPTLSSEAISYPKDITYQGISIHRVWGTRLNKKSFLGKLINQLSFTFSLFFYLLFTAQKGPLVALTNPPFLGIITTVISRLKSCPLVLLVFDVYPETAVAMGVLSPKSVVTFLWKKANAWCFKQASKIIVLGRCMETVIAPQVKDKSKIERIPIWADDSRIKSVQNLAVPSLKSHWLNELDSNFFYIGYSGNMGRFHDMETLVQAAICLKNYPSIKFLFVGDGHKKKELEQFINEQDLTNCAVHDYVTREELPTLLSKFNLGLVSLLPEQVGLSVPSKTLGLMAAGVPILAVMPALCEIAQMVKEEQCGQVIEPGQVDDLVNQIIFYFNAPTARFQAALAAKKAIETKYTLQITARRYYSLLSDLSQW